MRAARVLAALLALAGATLAQAAGPSFGGTVIRVSDGDTVHVKPDDAARRPVTLRLAGLDAPERCQAWGREATDALARRVLHRHVEVTTQAHDGYGRAVGVLRIEGHDVGAWLVAHGHAWSQHDRAHPGPYASQERLARRAQRGLFAQARPIEPRAFRQAHGPCR